MKKTTLTGELMAEFFGTFILILLGDGVVAHVGLAPRLAAAAYNWNTIVFGWGMAVMVAVYVAGGVSGAHINPAVTIALAVKRGFPWGKVAPYVVAQIAGAFVGALAVYLIYREGLIAAGMPNVWATGPGNVMAASFWGAVSPADSAQTPYSMFNASIAEFFGTMVLLWGIMGIGDTKPSIGGFGALLVGLVVLSVGLSLGGPSGYSINPARDLGPRLFGALVGTQGLFTGLYWLIPPVLVPAFSGAVGVVLYDIFIKPHLPTE
jgi:glycerol uptake facilitator protein